MIKCIRCGRKYDLYGSRSSDLTVRTRLKSDREVTIKVVNLCNECTKSLFIWLGGPLKEEDTK